MAFSGGVIAGISDRVVLFLRMDGRPDLLHGHFAVRQKGDAEGDREVVVL